MQTGSTRDHDFRCRGAGELHQPLPDSGAWRHHYDGHTSGVGAGKKPQPIFLKAGDSVRLGDRKGWVSSSNRSSPGGVAADDRGEVRLFRAIQESGGCRITGGASGVGLEIAMRIAAEGGEVSLWDRDAGDIGQRRLRRSATVPTPCRWMSRTPRSW